MLHRIAFRVIPVIFILASCLSVAQTGKDGSKSVTTANAIINEYTALTANAAAGSTSITVANNNLNANGRFTSALSKGDLVMIIQMQGATLKSNLTDSTWGEIINYNNCGNYEFAQVASTGGSTTITFDCPIKKDYTSTGKTQVIRVPRYTSFTITASGSVTCDAWNGTIGGMAVAEILGSTSINGSINVNGKGFRGGQTDDVSQNNAVWASTSGNEGAEKGESIAGYKNDYTAYGGAFSKGAPANGGGGGGAHNGGGGGGANGGDPTKWTGYGNPDISNATWATAWNLEYSGFATSSSSGGGRGGYEYSYLEADALTVAPGNPLWGNATNCRRVQGGFGGRPLDYSSGKIFMGGGGGAGDRNNGVGTAGANAGGMVFLLSYGTISGSGKITANGNDAADVCCAAVATDAPGGGGAGGTVILKSSGAISGISIDANGGRGGDQNITNPGTNAEAEGPGGGGGGGYIAISNGTIARTCNGGRNGITQAFPVKEFTPNGATSGGAGSNNEIVTFSDVVATINDTNICSGQSVTLQGNIFPVSETLYWYNTNPAGSSIHNGLTYTTPVLNSSTKYYIGICPGIILDSVQVTVSPKPTVNFINSATCNFLTFSNLSYISSDSISQWHWNFGDGDNSTAKNPSHTYTSSGTYDVQLIAISKSGCKDSVTKKVTTSTAFTASFSSDTVCRGLSTSFTNTSTGNKWQWFFGDGDTSTLQHPTHTYATAGTHNSILVVGDSLCSDTAKFNTIVYAPPTSAFNWSSAGCNLSIDFSSNASVANPDSIIGYQWSFGDGSTSSQSFPSYTYTASGSYNVQLVVTTAYGCKDTLVQNITAATGSVPTAMFNSNNVCLNDSSIFSDASSVAAPDSIISWIWNFGDGNVSSSQNPSHNYNASGTYNVTLVVSTPGGCKDSIKSFIYVNPLPAPGFSNNNTCAGKTVVLTNNSAIASGSILSYHWNFGDPSSGTSNTSALKDPSHLYNTAGTYTVSLTLTSDSGCTDSISNTITVNELPKAAFNAPSVCLGDTTCFIDSSAFSAGSQISWSWNLGDGSNSSEQSPCHTYNSAGSYPVQLVVSNGACADTLSRNITVLAAPIAYFDIDPPVTTVLEPMANILDMSSGTDSVQYIFSTGDSALYAVTENFSYEFPAENPGGKYYVTAIANQHGCIDSIKKMIVIEPYSTFYAPDAFSPNNDGYNDIFELKYYGLSDIELYIYDRWGNVVFRSDNKEKSWNGKKQNGSSNEVLQQDVYVWIVNALDAKGLEVSYKGQVTLVR